MQVSEASVTRNRSTIIVPAGNAADDGWAAFRNILVEIHEASQLLLPPAASSGPLQVGAAGRVLFPPTALMDGGCDVVGVGNGVLRLWRSGKSGGAVFPTFSSVHRMSCA